MTSTQKFPFISFGISAVVFLLALLWGIGVFGSITGNEMGYSILVFFLVIPLTSLTTAMILGMKNAQSKWLYIAIFGALGAIVALAVNIGPFWFNSLIPAIVGLGIGLLVRKIRLKDFASDERGKMIMKNFVLAVILSIVLGVAGLLVGGIVLGVLFVLVTIAVFVIVIAVKNHRGKTVMSKNNE